MTAVLSMLLGLILTVAPEVCASDSSLGIYTESHVDEEGKVTLWLTLKNLEDRPLINLFPMFHFHHSKSMMPKIDRLEPGQTLTLENKEHPPVIRAGRYPLVAMVKFHKDSVASGAFSQLHTDSFYFRDPVVSEVTGEIESSVLADTSLLKVLIRNGSESLKNVRLMLLLPPGLVAENFKGMMGFTLRGGEQKSFEVPVRRMKGSPNGSFPVHLTVEYAEMLKHYTSEIRGKITFGPLLDPEKVWPHLLILSLMGLSLFWYYQRKWKKPAAA